MPHRETEEQKRGRAKRKGRRKKSTYDSLGAQSEVKDQLFEKSRAMHRVNRLLGNRTVGGGGITMIERGTGQEKKGDVKSCHLLLRRR